MGFVVIRERIIDTSEAHALGYRESRVGQTGRSKAFRTMSQAQREAQAWIDSGDWKATIEPVGKDAE